MFRKIQKSDFRRVEANGGRKTVGIYNNVV